MFGRYDLAAKCYRQALMCVKETPALGEREKAAKSQEIQVTLNLSWFLLCILLSSFSYHRAFLRS